MKKILAQREMVPALLVVLAVVIGGIASPYFLDFRYLLDRSSLYVEVGLLSLGMTLVILCGQIDLSVASTLALVACVTAKMAEAQISVGVLIPVGLLLGAGLGWLNGMLISRLGLASFMVTLATMAAYRGLAQVIMGPDSAKLPPRLVGIDFAKLPGTPIPVPLVLLIFLAIAVGLVLHRTVGGRWIYAVGTNAKASLYSGVPVARVTVAVFTVSGLLAGLAGMVIASRQGSVRFDVGTGFELDAITAVVLGGTSIYGGRGSILGTMLALLILGLIKTGMGLANVAETNQLLAVGALLILAVLATNLTDWLLGRGTPPRVQAGTPGPPASSANSDPPP